MAENRAIAVLQQYPQERYNLLIPVKTIQELSPIHTVHVNEVTISPNPKDGDVYVQEWADQAKTTPKTLSLTKKGLSKFMAAAAIQHVETTPIPTQKCTKCHEAARATGIAPRCFECPFVDDVAVRVTVAVPMPSGQYRLIRATKELRMKDEKARMSEKQFKQFFAYRVEHAESKALNRALREALGVKSAYEPDELRKPFVVGLVVPNMNDPDLKRAMVARYASGVTDLFGVAPQLPAESETIASLPGGIEVDLTTGEVVNLCNENAIEDVTVSDGDDGPVLDGGPFDNEPAPINCEGDECGRVIEQYTDPRGKLWTAEELADWTKKTFGRRLCSACAQKAVQAARQKGAR